MILNGIPNSYPQERLVMAVLPFLKQVYYFPQSFLSSNVIKCDDVHMICLS